MALALSEQLLPWPEYRRLSKTPDSNHQINCKIRDCKWASMRVRLRQACEPIAHCLQHFGVPGRNPCGGYYAWSLLGLCWSRAAAHRRATDRLLRVRRGTRTSEADDCGCSLADCVGRQLDHSQRRGSWRR